MSFYVQKLSRVFLGICFAVSILMALLTKHYFAYANIFISLMFIFATEISRRRSVVEYWLNVVWGCFFLPLNIFTLVNMKKTGLLFFEDASYFFLQYLAFAIIGLAIKQKSAKAKG